MAKNRGRTTMGDARKGGSGPKDRRAAVTKSASLATGRAKASAARGASVPAWGLPLAVVAIVVKRDYI